MKKLTLLSTLLTICFILNAQKANESTEVKTKFTSFTSKSGSILSFEDYNETSLTSMLGELSMKKRIVKSGQDQKVFYVFEVPSKYTTRTGTIASEDMTELIKAINTLKNDVSIDISSSSEYMEKFYKTVDDFKIGYYVSNKNIKWYIDVDTRLSESTYFLKDIDSFIEKLNFIMK